MTTHEIDQAKTEAFMGKMVGILNDSFLGLMCSIGHQTGLFDTMADLPPSTSEQIANEAGLNERYVREWLGSMVTGGIVGHQTTPGTYTLPPEHAQALTRAAGPDNLASFTMYLALAGDVEQKVIECFRNGGGVPYSEYPRFQALMAEESAMVHDAALVEGILPLVPGLPERLEVGIDIADIGCGRGHAINLMAEAFPNSRFTGYDFSEEGIGAGREEAQRLSLSNAHFKVQDVAALYAQERYDFITAFDSVHDQANPTSVLKNIAAALRPKGTLLMVDIAASSILHENVEHPFGPALYAMSVMHCMTVSLAYGGEGLGNMWGEQRARQYLTDAGFSQIEVKQVPGDILNNYYIAMK